MAYPPVKLIQPSDLKLDLAKPCLLEIHIHIPLPHRRDPSLPMPPYILNYNDNLTPAIAKRTEAPFFA
jgi:hypothetical protein